MKSTICQKCGGDGLVMVENTMANSNLRNYRRINNALVFDCPRCHGMGQIDRTIKREVLERLIEIYHKRNVGFISHGTSIRLNATITCLEMISNHLFGQQGGE